MEFFLGHLADMKVCDCAVVHPQLDQKESMACTASSAFVTDAYGGVGCPAVAAGSRSLVGVYVDGGYIGVCEIAFPRIVSVRDSGQCLRESLPGEGMARYDFPAVSDVDLMRHRCRYALWRY